MSLSNPPAANEVEISVLGPGYGECIVAHLADSDWIIIDSCIDRSSKRPAALAYLDRLGVEPANSVKLVMATHWHDDHIRGLADTLRACDDAQFACSDALNTKEFLTVVNAYARRPMLEGGSGAQEFRSIIGVLEERAHRHPAMSHSPKWASADRLLWRREREVSVSGADAEFHSLSPSDASILAARLGLSALLPVEGTPKRRVAALSPNHAAVAAWLRVGPHTVLLGSDLEETSNPLAGWSAILTSTTRPSGNASVFKVAHHGSHNGDHSGIWTNLLCANPLAVVTPFPRGKKKLPTPSDANRICSRTSCAYITASPDAPRSNRPKVVERMMRGAVRSMRPVHGGYGHVRLRRTLSDEEASWSVELFGAAMPLSALVA
ncbi:MAG: MBL fold metallo-hydrolase [Gammaproteobacteria bacterium]|nr:MBL fold metallo-hydrolase [Gammaproteobacteria bacterium]